MKIIHFASVTVNYASGLSFSIPNLIKAQNLNEKENLSYLFNIKKRIKLKRNVFKYYDVFVLNSFFIPIHIKLLLRIPRCRKIILCPRGAFSLSNKYNIKKHVYSYVFFSLIKLRRLNIGIHFLTINEQKRSRFHTINEFIVGNSIEISNKKNIIQNINFKSKYTLREIVYVGRFSKHIKGLDSLFETLKKYREDIKISKLKFSFYGPETEDLMWSKNFVKNNNLNFVSFFQEIYGEEKEKVYNNSMFHILTSRSEGFPMSVLESAALYTPQILSVGTNLQQSMKKVNYGIAFCDSFIDKITELDFNRYKQMCVHARYFAEQHSIEIIGKKTIKCYQKV